MVSKIVAPKSRRLRMRRVLVPFFGGRFFGCTNGGGCRGSDGRPSSGTAGAAAEREQRQYQPDRERENRRLAAHSHYHCPHYRFHDARPLQRATVNDDIDHSFAGHTYSNREALEQARSPEKLGERGREAAQETDRTQTESSDSPGRKWRHSSRSSRWRPELTRTRLIKRVLD
jgi:hypothetical protein